ncbi:L,D-transpeptidase family protein [Ramlibacter sp.]|uniref:L,D-transpeptidase family protein n=1 Tax=Ramlibacter sp. TaxID=1917967 RepID=UPI002B99FB31|nr:L,D-transpeptidase family protein [Ramlibacter sp.]HWI81908.1 L,D-transpeptidase family protein [Ramlibacter sp.]
MRLRSFVHLLVFAFTVGATAASGGQPLLWFAGGQPSAEARQAVQWLLTAADDGLDPRDYDAAALASALEQAQPGGPQAQVDAALTAALQRYLADLQGGRVDPRRIAANFPAPPRTAPDTLALLRDAVANHQLAAVPAQFTPPVPMYAGLRQALARYRALAGHPAWQSPLPPLPRKLARGQPYAGLPVLAQRLQALGDLPADAALPERFDGPLVAALEAFQERHGLTPDGVLGRATLQQLEATPAQRARQIELALERLRWTPLLQGPRMVVVNVPEFVLRAYEVRDGRIAVRLTMKVIVGKALRTRTPLFGEDMRFIEFSPYWNVPPSIARGETVPRLRRDPGYFEREALEFVTSSGQVVRTFAPAGLDEVVRGGWRIRQRPGERNALGGVKFVFPNNDNIYLHDTPARQLFERERRDFSHGCIRVEAPVALAQFALQDDPAWTEDRIREAMARGVSSTVPLKRPLPVLIAYSTVIVRAGTVHFFPDLYGADARLAQALRARSAGLTPWRLRTAGPN